MLKITNSITIDKKEIQLRFTRSSGPGGQNVNKVSTAVQLRFDVLNSPSLPGEVRERLLASDRRITHDGVLIIEARRFRTQEANRKDALYRMAEAVRAAARKPKYRIKSKPSISTIRKRLDEKRRRSLKKRMRTPVQDD